MSQPYASLLRVAKLVGVGGLFSVTNATKRGNHVVRTQQAELALKNVDSTLPPIHHPTAA